MTSSDLQKALGVASVATANAWADELTKLSVIPVKRNSHGSRVLTGQQIEVVCAAFQLQASGQTTSRVEALKFILEPLGLLLVAAQEITTLSPIAFSPIVESFEPVTVQPSGLGTINIEPVFAGQDNASSSMTKTLSVQTHLPLMPLTVSALARVTKLLPRVWKLMFFVFDFCLQTFGFVLVKFWLALKRSFSIRDNPIWQRFSLSHRKRLVVGFSNFNHALFIFLGAAFGVLLIGYGLSFVLSLFKIKPLFDDWLGIIQVLIFAFGINFFLFLFLPNDI